MGYTTEFEGTFKVTPPLTKEHAAYLHKFSETRRMMRNAAIAETLPDPVRLAVGLPIGEEGGYFVGGAGLAGQDRDPSIINYNNEPSGQPGLWCQWIPTKDGSGIEWDRGEKFYHYVEWLEYLIEHFLQPWGYVLNGRVRWNGESSDDFGIIQVIDNNVEVLGADDAATKTELRRVVDYLRKVGADEHADAIARGEHL